MASGIIFDNKRWVQTMNQLKHRVSRALFTELISKKRLNYIILAQPTPYVCGKSGESGEEIGLQEREL